MFTHEQQYSNFSAEGEHPCQHSWTILDEADQRKFTTLWTHYTNGGTHPELGKGHRTGRLWFVISERMKEVGYNRGPEECKVRIGNLRAKYTKLKRSYLAGEGVPDWPYYAVLEKFLEGRGEFSESSYDAGSHSYSEEARAGTSHHHPGMFLSLSMEEPNVPLSCNVDGVGRDARPGSSRSGEDSSGMSLPDTPSSGGTDNADGPSLGVPHPSAPNGHASSMPPTFLPIKRRPSSPGPLPGHSQGDERRIKRPRSEDSMLLAIMQAMLKVEEEHLKLQQQRAASEAAMMAAVTGFFSNMTQVFSAQQQHSHGVHHNNANNHSSSTNASNSVHLHDNSTNPGGGGGGGPGSGGHLVPPPSSKTPSNPSSSCSNSPAYSHPYANPASSSSAHLTNSAHGHYPYTNSMNPSPSSTAAPMASPASYPHSPAYQQNLMNNSTGWYGANNGGANGSGPGNGAVSAGPNGGQGPMVVHPFATDLMGMSRSNRHENM